MKGIRRYELNKQHTTDTFAHGFRNVHARSLHVHVRKSSNLTNSISSLLTISDKRSYEHSVESFDNTNFGEHLLQHFLHVMCYMELNLPPTGHGQWQIMRRHSLNLGLDRRVCDQSNSVNYIYIYIYIYIFIACYV